MKPVSHRRMLTACIVQSHDGSSHEWAIEGESVSNSTAAPSGRTPLTKHAIAYAKK